MIRINGGLMFVVFVGILQPRIYIFNENKFRKTYLKLKTDASTRIHPDK